MTIADRYLAKEIYKFTALVLLALVGLFTFFSIIDRVDQLTSLRLSLGFLLLLELFAIPNRIYDLLPVAILIGSIIALAGLAQRSELVILRVSGLSGFRILRGLMFLLVPLFLLAFVFSEWVIPHSEAQLSEVSIVAQGDVRKKDALRSGFWFRESIHTQYRIINIQKVEADRSLTDVQIYQYSSDGKNIQSYLHASKGVIENQQLRLSNVTIQDLSNLDTAVDEQRLQPAMVLQQLDEYAIPTTISQNLVFARLIAPERMSIVSLWQYIQFLQDNQITADRQIIAFWSKLVYPLSLMVMVTIAAPIAFMHTRKGGVGGKVFLGILVGVIFYVFNQFTLNYGILQKWPSWLTATLPSMAALFCALLTIMGLEFQNKWHVWLRRRSDARTSP